MAAAQRSSVVRSASVNAFLCSLSTSIVPTTFRVAGSMTGTMISERVRFSRTAPANDHDLFVAHLIDSDPAVVASAPDRLRYALGLGLATIGTSQHATKLIE